MDNQHRQITGYRELDQFEIDAMNEIKERGAQIGVLIGLVENAGGDPRWTAIARTQLQLGFMALTRAIAKPTTF